MMFHGLMLYGRDPRGLLILLMLGSPFVMLYFLFHPYIWMSPLPDTDYSVTLEEGSASYALTSSMERIESADGTPGYDQPPPGQAVLLELEGLHYHLDYETATTDAGKVEIVEVDPMTQSRVVLWELDVWDKCRVITDHEVQDLNDDTIRYAFMANELLIRNVKMTDGDEPDTGTLVAAFHNPNLDRFLERRERYMTYILFCAGVTLASLIFFYYPRGESDYGQFERAETENDDRDIYYDY